MNTKSEYAQHGPKITRSFLNPDTQGKINTTFYVYIISHGFIGRSPPTVTPVLGGTGGTEELSDFQIKQEKVGVNLTLYFWFCSFKDPSLYRWMISWQEVVIMS